MTTIDEVLAELRDGVGHLPRQAIEEAIRRREEVTPHLLAALQEVVEHPPEPEAEPFSNLPFFSLYLLAQFREQRAYPLIVDLCKLPPATVDALLGDAITEGLPRILASVFDGDIAPIQSIVESTAAGEFVRGSAIQSLVVLVHVGAIARADVVAYFTELFRGKLEREHSLVWDELASDAMDLHATTLSDDIGAAYEEGLIDPCYVDPSEIEHAFAKSEDRVLRKGKERCGGLIDNPIQDLQWWACFQPKEERQAEPALQTRSTPTVTPPLLEGHRAARSFVRSEPKIGRNAPCPCGSGKKYKKCCGG